MATREPALTALNTEWAALLPGPAGQLRDWAAAEPPLDGVADLAVLLDRIRHNPDEVLAALLRLGAAGDPLAYRVVLQTMLGMLVRTCAGRPDLLPEAISELWLAIAEYPVERRPRAIASNLAWAVRRRLRSVPTLAQPAPEPPEPGAAAVLAEARQRGLIDEVTHHTLWLVYVAGMTSQQAAVALGTTAGAVRWRCSQALRRLAGRAVLLAA